MTVTIRHATLADYEELIKLFAETNRYHAERVPDSIQEVNPIITPDWLYETLNTPEQWLLVAEERQRLLGLLLMQLRTTPDGDILVPRQYIYVHEVAVVEERRGQGIGRALMDAASAIGAENGVRDIELDVWRANGDAYAFYQRLGFETVLCRMRLPAGQDDAEA